MFDFKINPTDFSSTEFVIVAQSEAAKNALGGGVSMTVRKSALPETVVAMQKRGFTVS